MDWWRRLLGLGRGRRDRKVRVSSRIEKAGARAARDPERALAELARLGRREVALTGVGAPLHEPFRDAVTATWSEMKGTDPTTLPTATLVTWRRWREPSVERVVEWARREHHTVLAIVDDEGRAQGDALLQLDALLVFAERPSAAMVIFDGLDLFARCSFLAHVGVGGGGSPHDIVRELADRAGAVGYEVVADPDRSE